jgi:beta-glucosidase
MHDVIEDLLGQMTLQEKVSLLAGSDFWHTIPVERLGIPALKVTDGPNRARGGGSFVNSAKTACVLARRSTVKSTRTRRCEPT